MDLFDVNVGVKFRDTGLASQPPEYRIHVVTGETTNDFEALHVASGNTRRFARTQDAVSQLRRVRRDPVTDADLDTLVGEKVRLELRDGTSLTGIVTAVRYGQINVFGHDLRYVTEVELDKTGVSCYPLREITAIQKVSR